MKLGEQWIEVIDGHEHMVRAVESPNKLCSGCVHVSANDGGDGYECDSPDTVVGCGMGMGFVIKDLGILKDGLLPCPFCGSYPSTDVDGVAYCNTCGCDIDSDKWNRRS